MGPGGSGTVVLRCVAAERRLVRIKATNNQDKCTNNEAKDTNNED
jgi:hypothetical protein